MYASTKTAFSRFPVLGSGYHTVSRQDLVAKKIDEMQLRFPDVWQHVHETEKFTEKRFLGERNSINFFKPLRLYECDCPENNGIFDRFLSPRRNNLEDAIVDQLSKILPNKKALVYILSMGSSGLMGDFLTIEKLILAGFTYIVIDCVDPEFDEPDPFATICEPGGYNTASGLLEIRLKRIREFFRTYPEITVEIHAYKNVDELPGDRKYNSVTAIDYDALFGEPEESLCSLADLLKGRRRLFENGFVALGIAKEDSLSGPHMSTTTLTEGFPFISKIILDLTNHLHRKDKLSIHISSLGFQVNIFLYALILAIERFTTSYQKIYLCFSCSPQFQQFLESFFSGRALEISNHKFGRKYDLVIVGEWDQDFKDKTYYNWQGSQTLTYVLCSTENGGDIFRLLDKQTDKFTLIT